MQPPTVMLNQGSKVTAHPYILAACECAACCFLLRNMCIANMVATGAVQGQQGASLQLTARLQEEIATYKPTLAINNGDIAYARWAPATAACVSLFEVQSLRVPGAEAALQLSFA